MAVFFKYFSFYFILFILFYFIVGIDKDTFLQYLPLNGLLGERLFAQFDQKKTGVIEYEDFIMVREK